MRSALVGMAFSDTIRDLRHDLGGVDVRCHTAMLRRNVG